jgi:hypothetical protein
MPLFNPLTTRWIRLQRGADQVAAEADAAAAAQAPVTPFGAPPPGAAPTPLPIRVEQGADDEDFGLERAVLLGWRAFFSRFRADESEFEMPHYLAAGRVVEDRLLRLGQGVQPDLITCRMMLELGRQFEEARFRDYNDRVAQLMESCQQLRAQLDVTELSKSHHEDEAAVCRDLLRDELVRRGLPAPVREDGLSPQLVDLLRALFAGLGNAGAAASRPAAPTTPATSASGRLVVDVEARDSLDWTKLHSAAALGRTELIELLVIKGADLGARAKDGSTPLHLAVKRGQLEAARFLLAHGADAAIADAQGCTPLHLAAEGTAVELIAELAARGAPLDACNGDGWTALHLAANRGQAEMAEALLAAGADAQTPAANGWSALKVALMSGHAAVCDLLRKRGTGEAQRG